MAQSLSLAFTFDQVKSGKMCLRMYIEQHAKAYAAVAWALLHNFLDRKYIEMYQGLAEGARLRRHLHALALRLVGDHQPLREDQAPAVLCRRRHHPHNPHPVVESDAAPQLRLRSTAHLIFNAAVRQTLLLNSG